MFYSVLHNVPFPLYALPSSFSYVCPERRMAYVNFFFLSSPRFAFPSFSLFVYVFFIKRKELPVCHFVTDGLSLHHPNSSRHSARPSLRVSLSPRPPFLERNDLTLYTVTFDGRTYFHFLPFPIPLFPLSLRLVARQRNFRCSS